MKLDSRGKIKNNLNNYLTMKRPKAVKKKRRREVFVMLIQYNEFYCLQVDYMDIERVRDGQQDPTRSLPTRMGTESTEFISRGNFVNMYLCRHNAGLRGYGGNKAQAATVNSTSIEMLLCLCKCFLS